MKFREQQMIEVEYEVGKQDPDTGYFFGGVSLPANIKELTIDVFEDRLLVADKKEPVRTGQVQIHLRGTQRAFESFAALLLAMNSYKSNERVLDPDYNQHFFDMTNSSGEPAVHLIVHAPYD